MPAEILQDGVVALMALAAGATLLRRLFGFARPRDRRTGCAACPANLRHR